MTKINRRDLIQRFGLAGIMLVPLFRQTRAYAAEKGKSYIQLFKPLGHPDGDRTYFPSGAGNNFSFKGKLTEALEPLRDDLIVVIFGKKEAIILIFFLSFEGHDER